MEQIGFLQSDALNLLLEICDNKKTLHCLSGHQPGRSESLLIFRLIKSDCDCRNILIFTNISITSDYYMQDGRCRLINRGNLLVRLMEWQAQPSEKTERQIVAKIMKEGGREMGKGGGGEVYNWCTERDIFMHGFRDLNGNVVKFQPHQPRAVILYFYCMLRL